MYTGCVGDGEYYGVTDGQEHIQIHVRHVFSMYPT